METSRWKRIWTKLRSWKFLAILAIVGLLIAAPFLYRASRLIGLPDIGAPFDVEKFGTIAITDEENAFVEYNQAVPTDDPDDVDEAIEHGWSKAPPAVKQWLEENRESLELMKAGSKKPKALNAQPKEQTYLTMISVTEHRALSRLARLEAARLLDAGDVEGAWEWYRVAFRHSRHVGMYSQGTDRVMGVAYHAFVCENIIEWSADPRVKASLLQRALENVIADYQLTQPPSTTLRIEYFDRLNWIDFVDMEELREFVEIPSPQVLFLKNEPEVTKRIVNLAFANWLSEIDLPRHRKSPVHPGELGLFEPKPGATLPGGLTPAEIEEFYSESPLAEIFVGGGPPFGTTIIREQTRQSQLVLTLATQLFVRENGRLPDSPTELLDEHLRKWPNDPYSSVETPMKFRLDPETGNGIVWSVGPNGVDDGGNVDVGWNDPKFDLGVTIRAPGEKPKP